MNIAPLLKEVARGKHGAKSMSRAQAVEVMGAVLDGQVDALQLGAFLIAMRVKGESLEELDGFLEATQARCLRIASVSPVVVLPSYNGSRRLPNFTPLLALLLSQAGLRVLVHGPLRDPGRVTSAEVLAELSIEPQANADAVTGAWRREQPAFVDVDTLSPGLSALLQLRWRIGLRNSGHTIAKLLDPCEGSPCLRVADYTHPDYAQAMRDLVCHTQADALLLRGTEGEPAADPRRLPKLDVFLGGHWREDLSSGPQEGVLAELPSLPTSADAATTAQHIQAVLEGRLAAPAPLLAQVQCLKNACAAMVANRPAAPAGP